MIRQIMNFDVTKNEYLCPICERLSNSVLPLMPAVSSIIAFSKASSQSFYSWVEKAKRITTSKVRLKSAGKSLFLKHNFFVDSGREFN
jgi:E3 ubiquitin-protein ligase UBR2